MRKLNRSIYLCLKHHENDINSRNKTNSKSIQTCRRNKTFIDVNELIWMKFKKTHRLFSSLLGNEELGRSGLQEDLVSGERCPEFFGDLSKFSKLISFAIHSIKLVENLQFANWDCKERRKENQRNSREKKEVWGENVK